MPCCRKNGPRPHFCTPPDGNDACQYTTGGQGRCGLGRGHARGPGGGEAAATGTAGTGCAGAGGAPAVGSRHAHAPLRPAQTRSGPLGSNRLGYRAAQRSAPHPAHVFGRHRVPRPPINFHLCNPGCPQCSGPPCAPLCHAYMLQAPLSRLELRPEDKEEVRRGSRKGQRGRGTVRDAGLPPI